MTQKPCYYFCLTSSLDNHASLLCSKFMVKNFHPCRGSIKCSSYYEKQPCSRTWLAHRDVSENLLVLSGKSEARTSVLKVRRVGVCVQQGLCGSRLGSVYSQPFAWNPCALLGFKNSRCASEYTAECAEYQTFEARKIELFVSLLEQALKYGGVWGFFYEGLAGTICIM